MVDIVDVVSTILRERRVLLRAFFLFSFYSASTASTLFAAPTPMPM
jgi:hypothetical protein